MTSPISICPLSAAGCPGKSFFTLTIVDPSCSGVRLSSRQKLNPRPELFFKSFTSNVLSANETLTYYFLQRTGHEQSVWGSYSRYDNVQSPPHVVLSLSWTDMLPKRPLQVKEDKKLITTSQSACLAWQHQYAERQGVSKGLFPRKSIKEPFKAQSDLSSHWSGWMILDRSHARRPKGIYSGSAIWAGFPSLAQVTSKRQRIMSISSQGHKPFSLHLALDVFSHLDRNCRTHRSSHLYITILIPLGTP